MLLGAVKAKPCSFHREQTMGKKNRKKVVDRLAKKRGKRSVESKLKHKKPPKVSKKAMSKEQKDAAIQSINESSLLLSAPQFAELHFDTARLTRYLEEVKAGGIETPEEFVREGLPKVVDDEFLANVRLALSGYVAIHKEEDPRSALSASLVLAIIGKGKDFLAVPFFVALFVREVKNHPFADDPAVWKLLSAFFPSRIVKPEQESKPAEEKDAPGKSEKYPHLVLPSGYHEEEGKESGSKG